MKEYIEREALIKYADKWLFRYCKYDFPVAEGIIRAFRDSVINHLPAADVVEVRHGRWKLNRNGSGTCSECGRTQNGVWDFDNWQRYCGCCGAKMDKEE